MLAIIGGSAFYQLDQVEILNKHKVYTPFGIPSSEIIEGELADKRVLFLPRHGDKHQFLPHEINYRANIYALKKLGASAILSVSAVGSLRAELAPGSFVIAKQYLDFTKNRKNSFFENGLAGHIVAGKPVCDLFVSDFLKYATELEISHENLSYVGIEGPRLSTKIESEMYRSFGADIIGMTNVPEVFLAIETQLPYLTLGIITDYDAWHESDGSSVADMFEVYGQSLEKVKKLVIDYASNYDKSLLESSKVRASLEHAVFSDPQSLSAENQEILNVLRT